MLSRSLKIDSRSSSSITRPSETELFTRVPFELFLEYTVSVLIGLFSPTRNEYRFADPIWLCSNLLAAEADGRISSELTVIFVEVEVDDSEEYLLGSSTGILQWINLNI